MVTSNDEQLSQNTPETEEPSQEVTTETVPTEPEVPEGAVLNPFSRLVAVVTDPVGAMKGVSVKSSWWVPLLLVVVAIVLFGLIAGPETKQFAVQQMQSRMQEYVNQGRMTQEQADTIIARQTGGALMQVGIFLNPLVGIFLMKFIFALLALLVGNIFLGGNRKLGAYWGMIWYAGVIGAISMVISGILIHITGDMQGAQLGLGIFTRNDPTSTLHKIFQVFNVFTIWEAIVAGVGISVLAKTSMGKGITWMLIIYLGFGLITSLLFGQAMV